MPHIGPYSSNAILSKPDGRTKEARLVASLRNELIAHVGGSPSVAERMMIDQACELQLRIAKMNREFMRDGGHTADVLGVERQSNRAAPAPEQQGPRPRSAD
jgi:hypothetical protein